MDMLRQWWNNDLSKWVKFVFFVLLANAMPATLILMLLPDHTDTLFVWTARPEINARLVGVMYTNALILVLIGLVQPNRARVRVIMVVITLFSILATLLTFLHMETFLDHPWFHLAYWLGMYFVLFFAAPVVFISQERKYGGKLPVDVPLNTFGQFVAGFMLVLTLVLGLGLLFTQDVVLPYWPWRVYPLGGSLIGVLFTTHSAAWAWSLWDGDWVRVRPMFWQAPITAVMFMLLPVLHEGTVYYPIDSDKLPLYFAVTGLVALSSVAVIMTQRTAVKELAPDAA